MKFKNQASQVKLFEQDLQRLIQGSHCFNGKL